ncbi:hypothetical protein ACQJBY_046953 [Aegilops geniculata]
MRNQRLAPTTCSSSKTNNNKQEEPHLSGAYIRSLVKHLSSSSTTRSKDHHRITMGTKPQQEEQQAPQTTPPSLQQQQQPHKKQVRRRLHTSRPYQERLLNMAEARREIVTALKIHRASMREAKEQQQHQQLVQEFQHHQEVQVVQDHRLACSAPSMSSYGSFSDYPFAHSTATNSSCSYYSSPLLSYHTPPAAPMVPMVDALDHLLPLPTQPLGLNLSFQGFGGDVSGEDAKNNTASSFFDPPPLLQQPSPASSYSVYSSPPATTMASQDVASATVENTSPSLHRVLDEEEMAAIYSVGEQHDIEWSDTLNLATSAWWSTLLDDGAAAAHQTDSVDVPGMHLGDVYYGEDVSFPCMEIEEMGGWDEEWLS